MFGWRLCSLSLLWWSHFGRINITEATNWIKGRKRNEKKKLVKVGTLTWRRYCTHSENNCFLFIKAHSKQRSINSIRWIRRTSILTHPGLKPFKIILELVKLHATSKSLVILLAQTIQKFTQLEIEFISSKSVFLYIQTISAFRYSDVGKDRKKYF
jgi:hypothetical protein